MKFPALLLAACAAFPVAAQNAPPLRLQGSTTVASALEPHHAELERACGRRLELQAFGTTSGLRALAAANADIAMLSAPLAEVVQRINEKAPGAIAGTAFSAIEIGAVRLAYIVNPRNPVRQLSAAQLADVFAGRSKNWRDVGGPDLPVVVVSLANAGPLVEEKLLHGAHITGDAHLVPLTSQIPGVVAQEVGAIGIVTESHARGKTTVLTTDANVVTPLILVVKAPPTPEMERLIAAAQRLLREPGS